MKLSTADTFRKLNKNVDGLVRLEGDLLKRYQSEILKIAEDIIEVCEAEHITYHLTGGTALGAVRHHGFIPWDDDMDIDILGSDFPRFIDAFSRKYGNKYWIHTCRTPDYGMSINRARLRGSVFRGREDIGNQECGFFVDLMRIENVPDNMLLRKLHGVLCLGMGFLLSCRNFYKNRKLMLDLSVKNSEARKAFLIKIRLGWLLSFMSVARWATLTEKCYGLCKNNHSKYVSVPSGRKHYFGEMYERSAFVETASVEFEGHQWCVPKEYDAYLKHMYGDYMKLPKENEREDHVLLDLKFPEEATGGGILSK